MLNIIKNLLLPCKHQWFIKREGLPYIDAWERRPMKTIIMQCRCCKDIKEKKIGA